MDERAIGEARIREAARHCRSAGGYHFRHFYARAFDRAGDLHQAVIPGVRDSLSFREVEFCKVPVIIMKAAKSDPGSLYCLSKADYLVRAVLLYACAIHARG